MANKESQVCRKKKLDRKVEKCNKSETFIKTWFRQVYCKNDLPII